MKNREKNICKILIIVSAFIAVISLVKVNVINTKALSPKGVSAETNYKLVKKEFGEDFENFIQDKANIKMYNEKDAITININDMNLKIKKDSDVLNKIFSGILNGIEEIGDKIVEFFKAF